jgi:hypothetical protein
LSFLYPDGLYYTSSELFFTVGTLDLEIWHGCIALSCRREWSSIGRAVRDVGCGWGWLEKLIPKELFESHLSDMIVLFWTGGVDTKFVLSFCQPESRKDEV